MQNPILFDHPVKSFEVIETHISWVLLTGLYAYKIKKPVNFGFLDFSTLEKRHFYCEEELRLNRRLARQIYLEVVTISRSGDRLSLNGQGEAVEYAVKMIEFPQSAQLDSLSAGGQLDDHLMDKLAERVAAFHLSSESASEENGFGGVVRVQKAVMENFAHLRDSVKDPAIARRLGKLEQWSRSQLQQMTKLIEQRKREGFVRLCHGDMHLRNIAVWDGEIIIFDCIEFNKDLHLIDVISEVAFLVMDLEAREHGELANFFLNKYIEITGDYQGLKLLRFYKVYRALVRAKVDILRTFQEPSGSAEYEHILDDFVNYIRLAEQYSRVRTPHLMINHGLSGSGKSAVSRSLATRFSAIQIRSDVERKRLFAKEKFGRNGLVEEGPYDPDVTWKVYSHLAEVAKILLSAGYPVIIDATNLKAAQRQRFITLARSLEVPWCILSYTAPVDVLRERIYKRMREGNDVSDATADILEHQITTGEFL
ncbi:MAG: bifunctional aminoglycoside phosphotransferase/ATP-binding protein, partial [Desulforhopalus sp.]